MAMVDPSSRTMGTTRSTPVTGAGIRLTAAPYVDEQSWTARTRDLDRKSLRLSRREMSTRPSGPLQSSGSRDRLATSMSDTQRPQSPFEAGRHLPSIDTFARPDRIPAAAGNNQGGRHSSPRCVKRENRAGDWQVSTVASHLPSDRHPRQSSVMAIR